MLFPSDSDQQGPNEMRVRPTAAMKLTWQVDVVGNRYVVTPARLATVGRVRVSPLLQRGDSRD